MALLRCFEVIRVYTGAVFVSHAYRGTTMSLFNIVQLSVHKASHNKFYMVIKIQSRIRFLDAQYMRGTYYCCTALRKSVLPFR